jgi:serine/threonine-protein kinase
MSAAADRHLRFGLLALQNGLIDEGQLVAGFQAWTRAKDRGLAQHLLDRGDLDADQCAGVEVMVALHLKWHGGDPERSLAAIGVGRSTRECLARIGNGELDASLAHVGSGSTEPDADPDPDRTATYAVGAATYAVGSPTSDGQRFQILRPHARGGLGAVFVARDIELNREVALKQILDHHADDQGSRARFVLEAEITGGLEHPGIVPVYGLGTYPDGRPYYAMRFIRGDSFREAIAGFHADVALRQDPGRRSLALRKLLRRFLDLCNAIDYAHSRGVLHRDIKPANVVLGKYGETFVVDWGLAKAVGRTDPTAASEERMLVPSLSSGSAETLPGSALGTPAYMSPEHAAGDLDRLGPRSDVYSLGATLYCLLTGKPPVENDDVGSVLRAVQKGDFRPPRHLDPAIDAALEAVCLKAMALRSDDRYSMARALAEDLERWMADEPVTARKEPLAESARRWMRRRRTAVTAGGAAVAAGVLGLVGVLAVQARANVVLKAKNGELIAANTRVAHANAELLAANERVRARFDLAMDAVKLFHGDVSADLLFKEQQFEQLRTKLLRGAAGFYTKLEGLLAGQTDRPSRAALGRAYAELGDLIDQIGSKPEALAVQRKAQAVRQELAAGPEADAASNADVARSHTMVRLLQEEIGDTSGALTSFDAGRRLAEGFATTAKSDEQIQAILGSVYQWMGRAMVRSGKPVEAMATYERSLAIRQALAAAHPDVTQFQGDLAASLDYLSGLLEVSAKPAEALAAATRSLAIRRKLADTHPSDIELQMRLSVCLGHVGGIHVALGRPGQAAAPLRQAVAIRERFQTLRPVDRYNLACGHADLAAIASKPGSGMTAAEGRAEADRTMHWLQQAVAAGYRNVALMRRDTDLNSLRSRPDFKLLMMDLEFPNDPFGRWARADRPDH